MMELWIEEDGQEQHRQHLDNGTFRLGRSAENEIYVPNGNISRHHLQLDIQADQVMVTDLGSMNGARLHGRALRPHQPTVWPAGTAVQIGPLTLRIAPPTAPGRAASEPPPGNRVAHIVSSQAFAQLTVLTPGTIFVGSAPSCAIQLSGSNIAPHHCRLTYDGQRLDVTNLDGRWPVQLAGEPLPPGQSRPWEANQPLQIGSAHLYLTWAAAGAPAPTPVTTGSSLWRYGLLVTAVTAISLFCFVSIAAAWGLQRGGCSRFSLDCLVGLLPAATAVAIGATPLPGVATPTAAPTAIVLPTPADPPQIIATYAAPSSTAVACGPGRPGSAVSSGWLDLPFPYQGTEAVFGGSAEQFRLISRRSRAGGRINSFFDHEFPVYPSRFGGWEPVESAESMVIFTGQRVQDAFAQDASDGYWYSGHPGIDFSPVSSREATTPVLAAAGGLLYRAEVDADGNHMVWLIHDPDGDGFYQYATLYFHLHPDPYFEQMVALKAAGENAVIEAGQRIGTMGTTGRSTGIHLHFEVRRRTSRNATFTRLDTVDPYGFFPTEDFPASPWSEALTLLDARGVAREHRGNTLDYLWIHPLTAIDQGETAGDDCPPPTTEATAGFEVEMYTYPLVGYSVIHPGFTFLARDDERNILDYSPRPQRREMILELRDEDYRCGIDVDAVFWSLRLPGEDQEWQPFPSLPYRRHEDGRYIFEAMLTQTGRYILVAKQNRDCVAPQTIIDLSGEMSSANVFTGSVTITLRAFDSGYPRASGVADTYYSLDCGLSWQIYREPFVVTRETPHSCGGEAEGEQGLAFDPDEFVLLASSMDSNHNIEEPPQQVRFTIR